MPEETPISASKACVLMSGGIESSVLLQDALMRYNRVTPLYVQNHLRWEAVELFWLKKSLRNVKSNRLDALKVLDLNMRDLYEGHWSITGMKVPGAASNDEDVYIPGRNIAFLSKASVFAVLNDIPYIEMGVLKGNPFNDSTPRFFSKFSELASLGLGRTVEIKAPFQKLKKEDVILKGKGLPLEFTFSCINPKGYEHCGECNKCVERKKAFLAAGLTDKTKYKKAGI